MAKKKTTRSGNASSRKKTTRRTTASAAPTPSKARTTKKAPTKKAPAKKTASTKAATRPAKKKTVAKKGTSASRGSAAKPAAKKTTTKKKTSRPAARKPSATTRGKRPAPAAKRPPGKAKRSAPPPATTGELRLRPLERSFLLVAASVSVLALILACVALFRTPPAPDSQPTSETNVDEELAGLKREIADLRQAIADARKETTEQLAAVQDRKLTPQVDLSEPFAQLQREFESLRTDIAKWQETAKQPTPPAKPDVEPKAKEPKEPVEAPKEKSEDTSKKEVKVPSKAAVEPKPPVKPVVEPKTKDSTKPVEAPREKPADTSGKDAEPKPDAPPSVPDAKENMTTPSKQASGLPSPAEIVALRKQREQLYQDVIRLFQEQDWDGALVPAEGMLRLDRQLLADEPEKLADALSTVAYIHEQRADYAAAKPLHDELLVLRTDEYGPTDPRVADTRVAVQRLDKLIGFDDAQREQFVQAQQLTDRVMTLFGQGNYADALGPAQEAAEIRKKLFGEKSVLYAQSLTILASLQSRVKDFSTAEPLFRQVADIRLEALGAEHPEYRGTLVNLDELYQTVAQDCQQQGDLNGAADAWQQLVSVRTSLFGADHWQVTDARLGLENVQLQINLTDEQRTRLTEAYNLVQTVSQLYSQQKFPEALVAARQVVDIRREILGEDHTDLAKGLVDLAALTDLTGEAAEAESLRQQALDIYRKVLGEQHPNYALFLTQLAFMFDQGGDSGAATKLYEQALAIYAATLGTVDAEYRLAHERLKDLYQRVALSHLEAEDLEAARQVRQQVLDLEIQRFGTDHWRTVDAQLDVKRIAALTELDVEQRQRLVDAISLTQKMFASYEQGRPAEAIDPANQALVTRREILGEEHIDTAESLNNLGAMYCGAGEYEKAVPLYQRAAEIRRDQLGQTHPRYSVSLNNLADAYREMGEYETAEPFYQEALEISSHWAVENPVDYGTCLNNLALLYHARGQYEKAERHYEQALELSRQLAEQRPAEYAQSLNNLADLCRDMGDVAQAESLLRKATDVRRDELGENHPLYANSLDNLALLCHDTNKTAEAEEYWKRAIEILKQIEPAGKNRNYARTLSGLAGLYHDQAKADEAGQLYQQALEIRREIFGEQHADYAVSLGNLAAHYRFTGRFDEAESLYEQSLEILKAQFGEDHTAYASMLRNLAKLHDSQGNPDKAEPLLRQSLEIAREKLDQMAAIQSERQQLAMAMTFRDILDLYLSLCARADLPADEAYLYVLRWKGAVFARQHELRSHRRMLKNSDDPEMASLIDDLEHTACQIATLALSVPPPDQRQARWRQLGELTRHKEELEVELAGRSRQYRDHQAVTHLTPAQLLETFPVGVVLVDLIEYEHSSPPPEGKGSWQSERRLAAFVVRHGEPIKRIDLGLVAPLAQAVTLWRGTINRMNPIVDENDSAVMLRRTVWLPIEQHLKPDEHVLVSPDGALTRMPLVALPGAEPNTYLIEERAIAVIAVPQLLPELLAEEAAEEEASMLLVGEVDFDAELGEDDGSGAAVTPTGFFGDWKPLPETRTELVTVSDSFELKYPDGRLKKLRRNQASEDNLRADAAEHRWLHLATHGFFAPPDKHSALAPANDASRGGGESISREAAALSSAGIGGYHPGVLSGVVLAGANKPSATAAHDGIITAMEVAELDLSQVEMVVLSACETGLGEVAGGEGVLGIQRAFQLAGVNTVVTSLWTVDDLATQLLMVHFYDQLWQPGKRKIGKLEAFRESQLMMLREGIKRGFVEEEEEKPEQPARTPPFLWAAFSISGDWR